MFWPPAWRDASLVSLLRGTPVNCLVLRQTSLEGLAPRAKEAGLALVARLEGRPDRASVERAGQNGFDAIALDEPAASQLPLVLWNEKSKLPWNTGTAVFAFSNAVWPGAARETMGESGPTGAPWVDSNGWFFQLARVLGGSRPVWANVAPPKDATVRAAQYALAIADAHAHGGRWVIELDDKLASALAAGRAPALDTWKKITETLRFFHGHSDWQTASPYANLAVVSDFSGANEFISHELLNLLPRRGMPFLIVEKSRAAEAKLDGILTAVCPDEQAPSAALQQKLTGFAEAGGLLLASAQWPAPQGTATSDIYGRWNVYATGKGRIAVARDAALDPYLIASDVQLLTGHRRDLLRCFNFGTLNGYYTAASENRFRLHVINYAARETGNLVSVAFTRQFREAKLWSLDGGPPTALELNRTMDGSEIHLPAFSVYAGVELSA